MLKLVANNGGHWIKFNNSMVFSNVVYLLDRKDAFSYILVDDNDNPVPLEGLVTDYIVDVSDSSSNIM